MTLPVNSAKSKSPQASHAATQSPVRQALFAPFGALRYLLLRPRHWPLLAAPFAINLLLFTFIFWLGWSWVAAPVAARAEGYAAFLGSIASVVMGLIVLVISGLTSFLLLSPIAAPFYDILSERIEREMLARHAGLIPPPTTVPAGARHAALEALCRLRFQVPLVVFVILAGFIPLVGPLLALSLGFALATFFLPLDAFSYSMDRRFYTLSDKLAWFRAHRIYWIMLGLGLWALLLIPCAFLWLPPVAAVAATRLYCRRLMAEQAQLLPVKAIPPRG